MSELTESVRKMLSQAQVFVTDTPFEAVSRVRQAMKVIDAALREPARSEEERKRLRGLRGLAERRAEKYEARLDEWLADSAARAERYNENERTRLAEPMRAKV